MQDKGWHAMGAFDPTERSRVLDLLGVEGQLVFATFATARFVGKDEDRLYAGSSAQNRAMAHFCSQDKRLLPVAFVPLVDPGRAIALAVEAIEAGCAAVMVPSTAAGTRGSDPSGPRRLLGRAQRSERALRSARGRRWAAPRPGLSQQRDAGYRPPGGWRECPIEGLPGDPPLSRGVPRDADLRRSLRPLPEAAWRVHRAGGGLGRVLDAPPRLRDPGLPPDRGAAAATRAPTFGLRPAATSNSPRSPGSRWTG